MRRLTIAAVLVAVLAVATPASADETVGANTVVHGRLERGDPTRNGAWADTYTYNGQAGQELRIFSNVDLRIDGPGRFAQAASQELIVRLPQTGRYRITASWNSYGAGPVAYDLGVWTVITEQQPSMLTTGRTVQGGISTADPSDPEYSRNRTDTYTYAASAGEAVTFHLEGQPTRSLLMKLVGADGVARSAFSDANLVDLHAYLQAAGEYRLIVSSEGGNYSLSVQPRQFAETATPIGHLAMGDTVELTPGPASAVDQYGSLVNVYTLDAQRGDRIAILVSSGAMMRLTDPNGRFVGSNGMQFTASVPGPYRIEAQVAARGMPPAMLQVMSMAQGQAVIAEQQAQGERERANREARIADALLRGDRLLNSGDNAGAMAAYNEVYPLDPLNVRAQVGAGVAAYRNNNRISAEMNFNSVLSLDPGNQIATAGLAAIRQTEAAEQRDAQLAYEQEQRQRQAENDQMLSNAIGGFMAGVDAGVAINNAQAEAEAAAAQGRADAQARQMQAAQQQQAASSRSQQSSSSSSQNSGPSRPVSPGGGACARVDATGHNFVVGANAGRFERYDYRLVNSCGISVVFAIQFANGSTRDVTVNAGASRDWFCTVGFLGNTDCVGGIARWSYR